jgi:hypothetical protein
MIILYDAHIYPSSNTVAILRNTVGEKFAPLTEIIQKRHSVLRTMRIAKF